MASKPTLNADMDQVRQMLAPAFDYSSKPDQQLDATQEFNDRVSELSMTIDDVVTERSIICWRIVREIGRLTGQLTPTELMTTSIGLIPLRLEDDPWVHTNKSDPPSMSAVQAAGGISVYRPVFNMLSLDKEDLPSNGERSFDGFPLLPHGLNTDKSREAWRTGVIDIVNRLQCWKGSPDMKSYGRRGLVGLLTGPPYDFTQNWPSAFEIMSIEQRILDSCQSMLLALGEIKLRDVMTLRLGLHSHESMSLVSLTRASIAELRDNLDSDDKAASVIVHKVENLVAESTADGDTRAALTGIKLLAAIHGMIGTNKTEEKSRDSILSDAAFRVIDDDDVSEPYLLEQKR